MTYYHVHLFQKIDKAGNRGDPFDFFNLTPKDLRDRVISRWDQGKPITWNGLTVDSTRAEIRVIETEDPAGTDRFNDLLEAGGDNGQEVTNTFITGPAGWRAGSPAEEPAPPSSASGLRDKTRVMVVHGRNGAARDAMFVFLRALGLDPVEWEEAVAETGTASPHNLEAVRAAMDMSQAVVVLLTAEDQAGLLPALGDGDDQLLRGQPRQNVMLEAGMAMGVDRARTILVELGLLRSASDFEGLNSVRMTNDSKKRQALRTRLASAGCLVSARGSDWLSPEAGGDFDAATVQWQPTPPPARAP